MNIIRVRSHRYPRKEEGYINTTYYDKVSGYLDIGFQELRQLNIILYPEFNILKKLFIDHNRLKELPSPKFLPHLEELTCSVNDLVSIPFYPKLNFLNIAYNRIINCGQYHGSNLTYFDCSHNDKFNFNFCLPCCSQLYINNTGINSIDLNLVPSLKILDCSYNNLKTICGGEKLVEIDLQYNNIINLPIWPKMVRLSANNNELRVLHTYTNLVSAIICYNKIMKIYHQPVLKKLIANDNYITELEIMPELELIDLNNNRLSSLKLSKKVEYVSLQFNPISNLVLDADVLQSIKELQVNFETYKHIYDTYYHNFDSVNVRTNENKLEQILKKISNVFDDSIIHDICKRFKCIKFKERDESIYKITMKIYWHYFCASNNVHTLKELVSTKEFQYLLDIFTKIYYKTIVVTLYFNNYLMDIVQESGDDTDYSS